MLVKNLVTQTFDTAQFRHPELRKRWIAVSIKIGGLLPDSLLSQVVQRIADLDLVLRCMEDEYKTPIANTGIDNSFHYQGMLSELWIGDLYEVFRLLQERKLVPKDQNYITLAHQLRLLRIPLEKHQIALDDKLGEPLPMKKMSVGNQKIEIYEYSRNDLKRSHIMPKAISVRGSAAWQAIDILKNEAYWFERRDLSDRTIAYWESQ